jgi:hypothetical protein
MPYFLHFWPFFSFSLKTNDIYPWTMSINEQNIIWGLRRQKNKGRITKLGDLDGTI